MNATWKRWSWVAVAAVAAVTRPLVLYTLSLAVLGAVHVLAELRYVGARFGARIGRSRWLAIGGGVLVIAMMRILVLLDMMAGGLGRLAELGVGVGLACVAWRGASSWGRVVVAGAVGLLAFGLHHSPVHALLLVAVLHNFTPLLFVAEAKRAHDTGLWRQAWVVFLVLPLVLASGWPYQVLHPLGLVAPETSWIFEGPLELQMRAYLPEAWLGRSWALHAFCACAFLQCMHYLFVIDVLPGRFVSASTAPRRWGPTLVGVGAVSGLGFVGLGFFEARGWYGVVAAVHAWIELPVFLLVLSTLRRASPPPQTRPCS